MKEESLLLLSDLQKLINQVVLIDYTIIILEGSITPKQKEQLGRMCEKYGIELKDGHMIAPVEGVVPTWMDMNLLTKNEASRLYDKITAALGKR